MYCVLVGHLGPACVGDGIILLRRARLDWSRQHHQRQRCDNVGRGTAPSASRLPTCRCAPKYIGLLRRSRPPSSAETGSQPTLPEIGRWFSPVLLVTEPPPPSPSPRGALSAVHPVTMADLARLRDKPGPITGDTEFMRAIRTRDMDSAKRALPTCSPSQTNKVRPRRGKGMGGVACVRGSRQPAYQAAMLPASTSSAWPWPPPPRIARYLCVATTDVVRQWDAQRWCMPTAP